MKYNISMYDTGRNIDQNMSNALGMLVMHLRENSEL